MTDSPNKKDFLVTRLCSYLWEGQLDHCFADRRSLQWVTPSGLKSLTKDFSAGSFVCGVDGYYISRGA